MIICNVIAKMSWLFSKDYAYISFDDPVTREIAISDPEFFLDSLEEKVIMMRYSMSHNYFPM